MGQKILVADDSVTIQKVIKLALTSEEYEIAAASTGEGLIELIRQEMPSVVLMDVTLPKLNAYELKEALLSDRSLANVKVVVMYSAFEKIDESKASKAKFEGRLAKPFDPSHLRKVVSSLIVASATMPSSFPPVLPDEVPLSEATPPMAPPPFPEDSGDNESQNTNNDALDDHQIVDNRDSPPPLQDNHIELTVVEDSPPMSLPPVPATERSDLELNLVEEASSSPTFAPPVAPPVEDLTPLTDDIPVVSASVESTLTNSTLKLSQGEDAWFIDDSKKMSDSALNRRRGNLQQLKPPQMSQQPVEDTSSDGELDEPASQAIQFVPPPVPLGQPVLKKTYTDQPPTITRLVPESLPQMKSLNSSKEFSVDQKLIEEMVQERVNKELEKQVANRLDGIIRDLVPRLAEEMLKKEIDRIMMDP